MARYGEELYETIVSIELTLVILAAPAATAGAICLDKARGTLDHMLATDLSNAEIVLGKIGVTASTSDRLDRVRLTGCGAGRPPRGIDPLALLGSFMTAIACAVLGCSLALTLSVWGRKTHEVLMLTYLILVLWVIAPRDTPPGGVLITDIPTPPTSTVLTAWQWLECSNPYYLAFAPYSEPGKVGLTTYSGVSWESCLFRVGIAPGPGNAPNSRRGIASGRAT